MPIELNVLTQSVMITKLSNKTEHVKTAHNISEESNTTKVSEDKLNVLNVLATLNSEETTAYQVDNVPLVETTLSQLQMEEVAPDQTAHKLLTKMELAVHVMTTNTGMMKLNQHNARTESAQLEKEFWETVNAKHAQLTSSWLPMVESALGATVDQETSAKVMDHAKHAQTSKSSKQLEKRLEKYVSDQNAWTLSSKETELANHVATAKRLTHQRLPVSNQLVMQDQSFNMMESAPNAQSSKVQLSTMETNVELDVRHAPQLEETIF